MTRVDEAAGAARLREAAMEIARELASGAVWSGSMCAFHGASAPESLSHPPPFRSMGGGVYEGSAGIARFLGLCAAMSGDSNLRACALGALRHAWSVAEGWSLFTGGMGVGAVTLELARRLDAPELVAEGTSWIERSSVAALNEGAPWDLLAGTAGVVVGLGEAMPYDLDGGWLARAFELGRGLLSAGVADGHEAADGPPLSWPLGPGSPLRLCGLAHGASGIALAFETLARLAPEEMGWTAAARRARAFERIHYLPEMGSWADLRPPETGAAGSTLVGYPHMWCHGSIGIAAERLGAVERDLMARADAVGGLAGARSHAEGLIAAPAGPGGGDALNGSLCHGLAGLIDLFVDAWAVTGDSAWMAVAGEVGDLMRNDGRRMGGWRSGVPGGWSAPGLMLGRSGTGWALLRLAEPDVVPSGWRIGQVGSAWKR